MLLVGDEKWRKVFFTQKTIPVVWWTISEPSSCNFGHSTPRTPGQGRGALPMPASLVSPLPISLRSSTAPGLPRRSLLPMPASLASPLPISLYGCRVPGLRRLAPPEPPGARARGRSDGAAAPPLAVSPRLPARGLKGCGTSGTGDGRSSSLLCAYLQWLPEVHVPVCTNCMHGLVRYKSGGVRNSRSLCANMHDPPRLQVPKRS
mmetsp:Transcript_72418/g.199711  ORF Transcript_72418/g.199711 Transcript_72418/m.199711 type:complete len:205 (+) Transcript_72418:144-758(+)